jgi:hypothetical protein
MVQATLATVEGAINEVKPMCGVDREVTASISAQCRRRVAPDRCAVPIPGRGPLTRLTPEKENPVEPQASIEIGGGKLTHSDGFNWLARAGFAARGAVYVIIGILAVKLALGDAGMSANQQGALRAIAEQPFGKVLLVVVAVALAGYALWRLVRALLGHGREASDSTFERVAALASGVVYAGFCAIAVQILLGAGGGSSGAQKTTAGVFGWPAGTWLVGLAGGVFIGVGLYQGYRGISEDFLKDSKTEQMSAHFRAWFERLGKLGYLARMVVFCLVGVFLIRAAIDYNPNKAVGLDGALAKVDHASYGPFLLCIVAAGLLAFGVYSLSDARYRRI